MIIFCWTILWLWPSCPRDGRSKSISGSDLCDAIRKMLWWAFLEEGSLLNNTHQRISMDTFTKQKWSASQPTQKIKQFCMEIQLTIQPSLVTPNKCRILDFNPNSLFNERSWWLFEWHQEWSYDESNHFVRDMFISWTIFPWKLNSRSNQIFTYIMAVLPCSW